MMFLTARKTKYALKKLGVTGLAVEVARCSDANLFVRADLKNFDRIVISPRQIGKDGEKYLPGGAYFVLQLIRKLEPEDAARYVSLLTMAIRLSLRELGIDCDPAEHGDLTIKGKVISHIGCEYIVSQGLNALVLGVRINVANDVSAFAIKQTTIAMQAVEVKIPELVASIAANLLQQEKEYYQKLLEVYRNGTAQTSN